MIYKYYTSSSQAGCVSNYATKCSAASHCCDPGAHCDLTVSFPQCHQPTSASGQCTNPTGFVAKSASIGKGIIAAAISRYTYVVMFALLLK